jgi:hypothetical protein
VALAPRAVLLSVRHKKGGFCRKMRREPVGRKELRGPLAMHNPDAR